MSDPATPKSLIDRIGSEALVTLLIAVLAVGAATISFKTHVEDFEKVVEDDIAKIEERLDKVEEREREDANVLVRVDTHVTELKTEVRDLKNKMVEFLSRLPTKQTP